MKRLIILPLLLLTLSLSATPISEQKAREIAAKFFSTNATRSSAVELELAWAGDDAYKISNVQTRSTSDSALMYIYNRTDSKGFVIIAGDDSSPRPILAFSNDNDFNTNNVADGARLLLSDLCSQIEDTKHSTLSSSEFSTRADVGNVVCEYKTALWGQGAPFKNASPHGRIGCVTTALAIVLHYNKWPDQGVGTTPNYYYTGSDKVSYEVPANTLGRTYHYNIMLDKYKGVNYTSEQGEAVAALFYDIGTAVQARFDENNTTPLIDQWGEPLGEYFRYNKGSQKLERANYHDSEWLDKIKENLTTHGPTIYRGTHAEDNGGHAFVMDGYTDADYFKFNFGWDGSSNGYYLISLTEINYPRKQAAIFYLSPDRDGSSTQTYRDDLALAYRTGSNGEIYSGINTDATEYQSGKTFTTYVSIFNRGVNNFNGQVGIAHCDKANNIKSILVTKNLTRNVNTVGTFAFSTKLNPVDIALGDKLRVIYKGNNPTDWQFMRRRNETTTEEVLLCAAPDEVAKSLTLEYDKAKQSLGFSSTHAIQFTMKRSTGETITTAELVAHAKHSISTASLEKGEYTLSFSSGGEPYILKVIF